MNKVNMIRLAVQAAGGRVEVCKALEISQFTVGEWQRKGKVPPHLIRPLCSLGGNVVSVDQVLAYIEERTQDRGA